MNNNSQITVKQLCVTAVFLAMNIALSSFGVTVPGGHMYLNDIVICAAALMFSPFYAIVVGGVGAFLGDLFFYPTPMFVSLVTRSLQAAAISLICRHLPVKKKEIADILALFVGAIIMVVGYSLGRAFIYSTPAYAWIKLPYQILQAVFGAVVAFILCDKCKLKEKLK